MKAIKYSVFSFFTLCLLSVYIPHVQGVPAIIAPLHQVDVIINGENADKPTWQKTWDKARQFAREDNLLEASRLYQAVLEEKPNIAEVRWEYCKLLYSIGDKDEAAKVIESLLELEPNNLEYLVAAGDISLLQTHYKKAVSYYGQVYEADPIGDLSDAAIRGLVESLKGLGKRRNAYFLLEQYHHRNNGNINILRELAELSRELGLLSKARHYYVRLAAINPEDKHALFRAAEVHDSADQHHIASEYWKKYLRIDDLYLPFHKKLAQYYLENGREASALPHLIKIYTNDKHAASIALQIAEIYHHQLKRPDKALLFYEYYNNSHPFDTAVERSIQETRGLLARQYLSIVENDAADMLWKDLDVITLNKHDIFLRMAGILQQQGKVKHEISVLKILLAEKTDDPQLTFRLANLFISVDRVAEAYELLVQLDQANYTDRSYLLAKANVELTLKKEKDALLTFNKYIEFDPANTTVVIQSLDLAGKLGLVKTLSGIWESTPEKEKTDLLLIYIEALRRNGLFTAAEELYNRLFTSLTDKDPNYTKIYFHYADTLLMKGSVFEAEQVVRQVLAKNIDTDKAIEKLVRLSIKEKQYTRAQSWLYLLAEKQNIFDFDDALQQLPEPLHFLNIEIRIGERELEEAEDLLLNHQKYIDKDTNASHFKNTSDLYLARVYYLLEEFSKCKDKLTTLQPHSPADSELFVLADIANKEGGRSLTTFQFLDQPSFLQLIERADYYNSFGRNEKALYSLNEALSLIPESMRVKIQKADTLSSLSRYQDARAIVAELAGEYTLEKYFGRKILELEFKSGNFKEIVKNVPIKDPAEVSQVTVEETTNDDTNFWRKLLLARSLWAENRREEAIKVYDSLLATPVDTMFLEKMEVEKINFNLPPLKKSFWNMITFTTPARPDPITTVMDPQFVASNAGQLVDDIAAGMYGKYRWQKLVRKELSAKKAVEERDYYRAEKEYLALYKEEKSEEALFDLAYIYNKLGHYGKEAELYEILKKQGPLYPGLDEYIQANVLKRQPRISTTFTNSRRKGRDGYINLKKRIYGVEGWLMPTYDQELKLGLYRNSYSSFDRQSKSWSNRIMGTYSTYFEDTMDLNVGIGTDNPTDSGTTEILYKFELIGRVSPSIEAYGRFEQDLVEDTMRSVLDSVIYRDIEAGAKIDVIPRLFVGADYRFRMYSDDNEQNRYKLWSMYHLFGEMSQLKVKYSYENIRNNSENVGRDNNFRNNFRFDDRVYWSPDHYWQHLFTVHFKHLFETSSKPEDPLSYFSFDYSYGYEENHNQVHGFDVNIFLEMNRHFLLKGNVSNMNGDDYEETEAVFSLIYRW